ncbi:hypothetical protein B0H11DRAFT_2391891 [Mycena galericulata]|nr:hypothetical protein B0H11DRAFT_2391891 [Mycena galericulata]
MSFRPRIPKAPRPSPSYSPVSGPPLLPHHRKKNPVRPLVYLHDGQTLAQDLVPPLPGQVGFAGDRPQDTDERPRAGPDVVPEYDEPDGGPIYINHAARDADPADSRHSRKRVNQATRWMQTIIPMLVPIYIQLIEQTDNLRTLDAVTQEARPCVCSAQELQGRGKVKHLKVTVLRWQLLEEVEIRICPCSLAAPQLLRRGFFPSAPLEPSLAVELRVLEFVMQLFLNMPPNNTAMTKTLETYLDSMGFKLENRDALRRRFGNALEWYTSLRHITTSKIDRIITLSRDLLPQNSPSPPPSPRTAPSSPPSSPVPETPARPPPAASPTSSPPWPETPPSSPSKRKRAPSPPDSSPPASSPSKRARDSSPSPSSPPVTPRPPPPATSAPGTPEPDHDHAGPEYPFEPPEDRSRPSDYLRARCPACFGGKWEDPTMVLSILLSGDACFTQRRNKGHGKTDPPRRHPTSVFVPDEVTKSMETFVDGVRPPKPAPKKKTKKPAAPAPDDVDDFIENIDQPLPKSVLDDCESSFTAADDRRTKSSTQFFDDTALMALNCRHDHLLFLVNMKSAGEKQYYMYALLEMLFRHLPRWFIVGFLYDIVCQLERSVRKWGFLPPEYMARLEFAVSVLHAFGHNWVCQMKYHPRRRTLFGLTDGEGTERFWHSISKLIAYLRVCGYHRRIYTLDSQIHHLQKASIARLGVWLARRWANCQEKRRDATVALAESKQPMALLREEYAKQVKTQSQPLPRRAKNAAKIAVEEALRLRKVLGVLKAKVQTLEERIVEDELDAVDMDMAIRDLNQAKEKLQTCQDTVRRKEAALGVDDRHRLTNLVNSAYIQARMNARALKFRLRAKLRARKFELDRVERTFRRKQTDAKLKTHIEDAVKRRDPGILQLLRHYNELCKEMATLIKQRKAPRNAIAPKPIESKGIWALDVDDEIWQDVGLDDTLDGSEPPLWLKSDAVRQGIKAMLELDRCDEEQPRLFHECRSLRYWLSEEWEAVTTAMEVATEQGDLGVAYQLQLRRHELCQLCAGWQLALRPIPFKTDGGLVSGYALGCRQGIPQCRCAWIKARRNLPNTCASY